MISSEIIFSLIEDTLIISYDGDHFTKVDLDRLCDLAHKSNNQNTKPYLENKIGQKGIGFKAVFAISSYITVISGPMCFRFFPNSYSGQPGDEATYPWQIMPVYTKHSEIGYQFEPSKVTIILEKINRSKIEIIKQELDNLFLKKEILLFLCNISSIKFIDRDKQFEMVKSIKDDESLPPHSDPNDVDWKQRVYWGQGYIATITSHSTSDITRTQFWLKQSFKVPNNAILADTIEEYPPKYKSATHIEVEFATSIEKVGEYFKLDRLSKSTVYSGLPTIVETTLPFLINSRFDLNEDRTVVIDNSWNQFLLQAIARYQFDWFAILATHEHYKNNVLLLLEPHCKGFKKGLKKAFAGGFTKGINSVCFVPSNENTLLKVSDCIIDQTKFFHFFSESRVNVEITNSVSYSSHYVSEVVERKDILLDFKVQVFNWNNLINIIANYINYAHQTDPNLEKKILKFVITYSGDFVHQLLDKPLLKAKEEEHLQQARDCFLLGSKEQLLFPKSKLFIIEPGYYDPSLLKSIETRLGVPQLDFISFVKKRLVIMLKSGDINSVNSAEYFYFIYIACSQDPAFFNKIKNKKIEGFDLGVFPVLTRAHGHPPRWLSECYLPPPRDQTEISPQFLLDDAHYKQFFSQKKTSIDPDLWNQLLMIAGVKTELCLVEYQKNTPYKTLMDYYTYYNVGDLFKEYLVEMIKATPDEKSGFPESEKSKTAIEKKCHNFCFSHVIDFDLIFRASKQDQSPILLFIKALSQNSELMKTLPTINRGLSAYKLDLQIPLKEQFLSYFFRKRVLIKALSKNEYYLSENLLYAPRLYAILGEQIYSLSNIAELHSIQLTIDLAKLLKFRTETELQAKEILKLLIDVNASYRLSLGEANHITRLRLIYQLMIEILSVGTA